MNKKVEDLIIKNTLVTLNKNFRPFEAKIYYGLLSKFTYEYRVNNVYERKISMNVSEVKKLIKSNGNISFLELVKKVENMETWLKIQYDENLEVFESMAIITGIKIENDIIHFVLNNDICEMAKEKTSEFAIIRLMELSKLSSSFSLKAYELCCVYKNLKSGFYNMPKEKFLWYFNIPKSYSTSDVDKRVLNQVIKEINTKTRFELNISKVKNGKKITHYRFYINENESNYLKEEVKETFFENNYNKKVIEIKMPDSKESDKINEKTIENSISHNEFFEKIWRNILKNDKTKGSRIRQGKGSVKDTQRKKLMKIGEETLNKCLDLYLSEHTNKKYHLKGSTWLNSGYEDYLEQAKEIKVTKVEEQDNDYITNMIWGD